MWHGARGIYEELNDKVDSEQGHHNGGKPERAP